MGSLGDIQRIDKITDLETMLEYFIPPWHPDIIKDYGHGGLFAVIAYGSNDEAKSGCVVKIHDHIAILYYLDTRKEYVNHGLATAVAKQAAEWCRPTVTIARYRRDEGNVAKLLSNAGYRIIHEGADDFIIVAF